MVNVMGMLLPPDEIDKFGSIRLTSSQGCLVKEYILKSEDIDKLNLITNADDGSTAFCTDNNDLYIKHLDEWCKVGVENE